MTAGTSDFPTSLDTTTNLPVASGLSGVELDGDGNANKVHSNLHGTTDTAVVAIETKMGTGASTPTSGNVLRGTGTGTSAWAKVALTTDVTGTLPVGNGGTGATTLTDGGILLGSGTGAITATAVLGDGEMLVGDGTTDPAIESGATLRTSIGLGDVATRDTGISNNNIPIFTSGAADNDFLRIDGTAIEGRSASEVLSDIGASAAAGSSSIVTTGALDSGSITSNFGTINNGASAITTTGTVSTGDISAGGNVTLADAKSIVFDPEPASDHNAAGMIAPMTAGATLAFGDAVYQKSDGEMHLGDADAASTSGVIAIAVASGSDGASSNFMFYGFLRDDSWNWTVGGLIYLSTTGTSGNTLTQTAPSGSGDIVQILGVATHADRIFFNPSLTYAEV
tara:strand:- start:448 stop:1635 length:1188 start_codon:yes stop_codon:yes gene_type:complete